MWHIDNIINDVIIHVTCTWIKSPIQYHILINLSTCVRVMVVGFLFFCPNNILELLLLLHLKYTPSRNDKITHVSICFKIVYLTKSNFTHPAPLNMSICSRSHESPAHLISSIQLTCETSSEVSDVRKESSRVLHDYNISTMVTMYHYHGYSISLPWLQYIITMVTNMTIVNHLCYWSVDQL